ncbi:winged helix-turn-helix domain-containing protein [Nocardioides terrigena]|uniref:winged helix-turn-helix domain-containing protein n=1 Tax=Nocardioides terrigena TaxID=424797 RepID=UPI001F1BBBFC|nr:winged helix-turn-helix domain-containing protein [Nocardioides terrigena]
MADEYCDLCDLPKAHCIHGMPPAPPPEARPAPTRATVRKASTPRASTASTPAAPVRRAPRRWTQPEAIAPVIVAVLDEAGGELPADDVLEAVEARIGEQLLEGDRQLTPEGELRWRYAARRARQQLIQQGLMAKSRPGIWELTAAGRTS